MTRYRSYIKTLNYQQHDCDIKFKKDLKLNKQKMQRKV